MSVHRQKDGVFLDLVISTDAVHVLGGSSAHYEEHITAIPSPPW